MDAISTLDQRFPRSFAHHGLTVYGIAFEAMVQSVALAQRVPRGYRSMADQLKRSSTGTVAAIAFRFAAAAPVWLLAPRFAQLGGCVAFVVFIRPRIRSFG